MIIMSKMHSIKAILRKNGVFWVILLAALIVRVAYLYIVRPPIAWYDSGIYDGLAWSLANGNGYSTIDMEFSVQREPGYSLFLLAPIYYFVGHSILAVQIAQIILGLAAIILIYLLSSYLFSRNVGLISAFLLSFHPTAILYSGEVMTENFYTLLLMLATLLFFVGSRQSVKAKRYFFLAGLLFGVASLVRMNTVFVFSFLSLALVHCRLSLLFFYTGSYLLFAIPIVE